MVLQLDRAGGGMRFVLRDLAVSRGAEERTVVVDADAVVQDGHACRREQALAIEERGPEQDVVALPGRPARSMR